MDLQHDLEVELQRLVRLNALGGRRGALARRPPHLIVRAAKRERRLYGFAHFGRYEIVVIEYATTTRANASATLLHELVHLAGYVNHDIAFKHTLSEAAREAFSVDVSGYERGRYGDLDRALERELAWKHTKVWAGAVWTRVRGAIRCLTAPRSSERLSLEPAPGRAA